MDTKEKKSAEVTHGKICPMHHIRPVVNIDNDHLTIRCCCDFLTRKYISDARNKLKGMTMADLIEMWETDLLVNELYAE